MLTSSQKVFDVLEFLCANGPHKALEVSKALSLQKSSVHRFLNSLIEFGYVRKDDQTGLFSVTLKVVQLGAMVSSKIDMVETGRSYMRELVATFDQATVSFATFMDKQVLVLRREYPRNCVTRIDLSQQLPAYCTGLGKALLSTKSEEEIDEYIATVPRTAYTLHTLTDGARLKQDLLAAKEKGYAEDISEISDSLHCVAVPILTPHGGLWAISLSGHCSVIREYGVENIVKHLKKPFALALGGGQRRVKEAVSRGVYKIVGCIAVPAAIHVQPVADEVVPFVAFVRGGAALRGHKAVGAAAEQPQDVVGERNELARPHAAAVQVGLIVLQKGKLPVAAAVVFCTKASVAALCQRL